jgi:hypothetical protein
MKKETAKGIIAHFFEGYARESLLLLSLIECRRIGLKVAEAITPFLVYPVLRFQSILKTPRSPVSQMPRKSSQISLPQMQTKLTDVSQVAFTDVSSNPWTSYSSMMSQITPSSLQSLSNNASPKIDVFAQSQPGRLIIIILPSFNSGVGPTFSNFKLTAISSRISMVPSALAGPQGFTFHGRSSTFLIKGAPVHYHFNQIDNCSVKSSGPEVIETIEHLNNLYDFDNITFGMIK